MRTQPSILIADDDEDDRLFLEHAFHHHDFHDIAMFADATEVLRYLETTSVLPQIMVSDFNMPVITGLDLLTKVKQSERLRSIKVYILSTSDQEILMNRCLKVGAAGYYVKPNSQNELFDITGMLIESIKKDNGIITTT